MNLSHADQLSLVEYVQGAVFASDPMYGGLGYPLTAVLEGNRGPNINHFLCVTDTEWPVCSARLRIDPNEPTIGIVERVGVLPVFRGRHVAGGQTVGEMLMQMVVDGARERGIQTLTLEARLRAVPFYERLGFVASGPTFTKKSDPLLPMAKSLTD